MRLKLEFLDDSGHPKRRNRPTRQMERTIRESARKHGRSVEDVARPHDLILAIPETKRALDRLGVSPEELATWCDREGAPHFGDLIRRLFGP